MEAFISVISEYLAYGVLAFIVTVFATPLAANLARRYGVMDVPDSLLKPHARPTPYMGGVAICLGWAVAAAVGAYVVPDVNRSMVFGIVAGGIAMSMLGLIDDLREVQPKLRILISAIIVALVMAWTGAGTMSMKMLLGNLGIAVPDQVVAALSIPIGLIIVIGACNSANLIDGLDGLCAGVTAVISLGFLLLATHLAVFEVGRTQNEVRLILTIALLGATLGFLPLNFNPAKIFMGDAGSMLLGYNCGMMILLFAERGRMKWLMGGLMVFALPIFDTALAIVRRWRSGKPIFIGDRSHFYDQLVDRGWSVRRVVTISYAFAALYGLIGLAPIWLRTRWVAVLYVVVLIATVLLIVFTKMIRVDDPAKSTSSTD